MQYLPYILLTVSFAANALQLWRARKADASASLPPAQQPLSGSIMPLDNLLALPSTELRIVVSELARLSKQVAALTNAGQAELAARAPEGVN
jgi:hypothetical protein